jgi:hypothetical protein
MRRLFALFLVGLVFLSFESQANWDQLWNKEVDQVVVDQNLLDGTTRLFALEKATGDLYQYGGTLNSWTKVGNAGVKSIVSSGEGLYELRSTNLIYKYIGSNSNRWKLLSNDAFETIIGGGGVLYATKSNGDIYRLNGNIFTKIGEDSSVLEGGGCQNCWGDMWYGYVYNNKPDGLWRYPSDQGWSWTKIGDPAALVYAGSSKTTVFASHLVNGNIYRYKDGTANAWDLIGGPGYMWAIDIIGKASGPSGLETLYGLSGDRKQIWRWEGQPEEWTQIDTSQLNKPLRAIYAGGGKLYAVASRGRLWMYSP